MDFKVRGVLVLLLMLPTLTVMGTKNVPLFTMQEKIEITGRVVDMTGEPLPGANIIEKGTMNGTITDADGTFSLQVDSDGTLVISYVGFVTKEIPVDNRLYIRIEMAEDELTIQNIVVTALGLKKNESELTYSMKQVSGEELTRVKDANLMNSLTGKVAGMQVNKTSSGLGASTKVLLRGIRSVNRENAPLYVIDGIPISNTSNEQAFTAVGGTADSGNRDGGDGISNINPEDIASISVLKGAPAAALYGSQAANGVILITTKRGQTDQRKITYTSNLTFDRAVCLPEFQNSYGVSDGIYSWGEKADLPAYDNVKDFYNTGVLAINSLSISAGSERYKTYFSYANTTGKGITDHNSISKHNFNLRETASLFDNKLKLDGNINLFQQKLENRNPSGGFYMNPLVGLYRFPRGMDITPYKENFEVLDPTRNLYVQNWHSDTQDFEQNPYWVLNRIESDDIRKRVIASVSAEWIVNSWLRLQARGSVDNIDDRIRQRFYASTAPALAGANGRYIEMYYNYTKYYGDVMAMFNKEFGPFKLQGAFGGSIEDKTINSLRYDSKTASLKYANVFNIANIIMSESAYINQAIDQQTQLQSVFGTAQLGYRESLFLDITARNDWDSTIAFTSSEKKGYFYPSVGGSWIINKMLTLPAWVSFSKVRAAWSKVGNGLLFGTTNNLYTISAGGGVNPPDALPLGDLKPEMTTSVELGTEWKFLDNRLSFSATWYKTNTRNQLFELPAPTGDVVAYRYVNAGNIQNTGWELYMTLYPFTGERFTWRTELNFSQNRNKVVTLHDELPIFTYGPQGFSSSYAMKLMEGGSFGDIYGKAFRRDESGKIQYETEGEKAGLPLVDGDGNLIKVGNCNPKFNLSWSNSFSHKQFSLSFLIDSRFGGDVLSQTLADMDLFGVTDVTAKARDAGYVDLEGHRIENVEGFYKSVGGRAGVTEYYMYDATNIRLRELSIGYTLPKKWMEASKVFKSIQLSFVGRNLFFIYKKAPFDPELVLSTRSDNQGIEVYGMPTTRSLGFNLKCEF